MKKNNIFIVFIAVLFMLGAAGHVACAEKAEFTKEELLQDIKDKITSDEEVLDTVPGLKAEKDASGKAYYTLQGVRLEEMSKEDLKGLSVRIGQLMVKMQTERIQRQLDIVNQARRPAAVQAPKVPPAQPPMPPRAQTQPQVPRVVMPPAPVRNK